MNLNSRIETVILLDAGKRFEYAALALRITYVCASISLGQKGKSIQSL